MNKEEFNALGLEEQVQYINECLQNTSMVKVCQAMGVDESTIRTRFNSNGYKRQGKRFVDTGNTINIINTNNTIDTTNTKKANKGNEKAREVKTRDNNIKVLENRIDSLEQELEQIKAIISSNTNNIINTDAIINTNNTGIKTYGNENLVSRSYKIDKSVLDEFVKFCNVQKLTNGYLVSDLATNAFLEYMNKFK